MEIGEVNYKKLIKLSVLLISSLLIAKVSADTVSYLYLQGNVSVATTQDLVWIKDGSVVSGDTVTMDLSVQPSVTTNVTDRLYLKNQGTSSHSVSIMVTSAISGFTKCDIHIYENSTGSWEYVTTLDATSLTSQYTGGTLAPGKYYKFDFEITAPASGSGTFSIKVEYS